jgi:hypothetical protein
MYEGGVTENHGKVTWFINPNENRASCVEPTEVCVERDMFSSADSFRREVVAILILKDSDGGV